MSKHSKKTLQNRAIDLLKQYEAMEDDKRHYDNQNWHCVDVKRYNDYFDIKDLKEFKECKYQKQLLECFDNECIDFDYQSWLEMLWEQLNYEISDIKEITKGCKDKHNQFKFIKIQRTDEITSNDTIIYSMGRSGGWACFQDNFKEEIDEILQDIIDWDIEAINYDDANIDFDKDLFDGIIEKMNNIEAMIEEVDYIKSYIAKYNKNADWEFILKDLITEKISEYKEIDKNLAEDKDLLITDITSQTEKIQRRLNKHKKNKLLKENLQRHITGIARALLTTK